MLKSVADLTTAARVYHATRSGQVANCAFMMVGTATTRTLIEPSSRVRGLRQQPTHQVLLSLDQMSNGAATGTSDTACSSSSTSRRRSWRASLITHFGSEWSSSRAIASLLSNMRWPLLVRCTSVSCKATWWMDTEDPWPPNLRSSNATNPSRVLCLEAITVRPFRMGERIKPPVPLLL